MDVAVSGQALAILCGVVMLLFAALWLIGARLVAAERITYPSEAAA